MEKASTVKTGTPVSWHTRLYSSVRRLERAGYLLFMFCNIFRQGVLSSLWFTCVVHHSDLCTELLTTDTFQEGVRSPSSSRITSKWCLHGLNCSVSHVCDYWSGFVFVIIDTTEHMCTCVCMCNSCGWLHHWIITIVCEKHWIILWDFPILLLLMTLDEVPWQFQYISSSKDYVQYMHRGIWLWSSHSKNGI